MPRQSQAVSKGKERTRERFGVCEAAHAAFDLGDVLSAAMGTENQHVLTQQRRRSDDTLKQSLTTPHRAQLVAAKAAPLTTGEDQGR